MVLSEASGHQVSNKNWSTALAIIDAETGEEVDASDLGTDLRELGPTQSTTLTATSNAVLESGKTYLIGLRLSQPHADEYKLTAWNITARNMSIMLANEVNVIDGVWGRLQRIARRLEHPWRRPPPPTESASAA